MKSLKFLFLLCLLISYEALSQQRSFMSYYQLNDFLQASPGAFKYGLYGFENPAMTTYLNDADIMFTVSGQDNNNYNFKRWGLFTGSPHSGFGLIRLQDSGHSIIDYRYSLAFGGRDFSIGFGYGFTGGDKGHFNRSNVFLAGLLYRPLPYLSIGLSGTAAIESSDFESVLDIAVRPIKNYPLTFYGDYAKFGDQPLDAGGWSAGVSWEFVDGFRLNTRYFKNKSFNLGVDLSLGNFGISSISNFNDNSKYTYNSYSIRMGAKDRTVLKELFPATKYAKLDLSGQIKYQKFVIFDNSKTLLDIIKQIDVAKKDNSVKGILVNISQINTDNEILWEIREKLKDFRSTGKKVIIFMERCGIKEYHLSSVADKIIIDPQGAIRLEGYLLGRSFYKSLLAKIGVGFEEIRLFKYKSAVENFARDKMSEADREQRQALVDAWYETAKTEICNSRGFSPSVFDSLVNGEIAYFPSDAIQKKLVDTTGRWVNAEDIAKKFDKIDGFVESSYLKKENEPFDDKWGEAQKFIAVIYAVGECDMEQGIHARKLVEDVKKAAENNNIKAIVLRVDSPGGDAMASDYIADVVRAYKDKKPIIVSQGFVAASGGYWLSMDAKKIVAAPMTITGSIGVISGWFYDKGMKDSLGISTDFVKVGKYADLGYPFQLPLIGIGLPVRDLNDDERGKMENSIKTLYKDFVGKVAAGRNMKPEDVDKIAQGRVWSGVDAKKIGLVDELGGLEKAIQMAKEAAGIPKDGEIDIVEYPKRGFLDFSALLSQLFSFNLQAIDNTMDNLKFRLVNNGVPMPVLPMDYQDYVP
ncbi:MAG: signal peptide peptidase SppA, partial [FCB group bacterium]